MNKTLFVKPPDRFLEDEFVYQQLGPHYLQSHLSSHGFPSDLLILHRDPAQGEPSVEPSLTDTYMLAVLSSGDMFEGRFDIQFPIIC